jgi:hypothetical protein
MTYKINDTELLIQPTDAHWISRESLARDGVGHNIYPGIYQFEMTFQLEFTSGTSQLQDFYDAVAVTGTAVVELPRYNYPTYEFFAYSGCVIDEPIFDNYFAEHQRSVKLLISNIRT